MLAYQPFVDAATGAVTGFEALLRWHHAALGPVSPADFVPVAERHGLIGAMGTWVLDTACRQAATWRGDCRVSVNVSPVQLRQPGLFDRVASALEASGLPPHRLELELTESVMVSDVAAAINCIRRIRALGVNVALDDFGTGYSSLGYLQRFVFDRLKIDRSFIQGIDESQANWVLVRAMHDIARGLGMAVTAEGVETEAAVALLRGIGCDELQGFLFSRPVDAAAVRRLLADPTWDRGSARAATACGPVTAPVEREARAGRACLALGGQG